MPVIVFLLSGAFGTGLFVLFEIQQNPSEEPKKPAFSVTVGANFINLNTDRRVSTWWVVYPRRDKMLRAPITNLFFLTFTNLREGPQMIASYSVEVRTKGRRWQKMTRIPISSAWGTVYYVTNSLGPEKALQLQFDDIFDEEIKGKKIPPGDTVSGWAFFEAPKQYAGNTSLEWQFRATDISNVEFAAPITFRSAPLNENVQWLNKFTKVGEQDIRDTTPVLYSEERPR